MSDAAAVDHSAHPAAEQGRRRHLRTADGPEPVVVAPGFVREVTRYERFGKRVVDIAGSLVLILVLLPIIGATALAVRLSMGRGVFYLQERVGRGARTFTIYKFRSMRPDRRQRELPAEQDRRHTHKTDRDPRHTKVGRVIRKLSLDELPQLLNILKGDMSLVGPRPEIVSVARKAGIVEHPRHLVRPGLTGPWQLSQWRDDPIYEHLEPDEEYVRRVTFRGDVALMARTVGAVVGGRGH